MNANADLQTPPAVEALVSKLQADSGKGATISVVSDGFSHARSEQKFKIVLIGRTQALGCLVSPPDVQILGVCSKRSGPNVRTTINVKVANSSAHHLTPVNR